MAQSGTLSGKRAAALDSLLADGRRDNAAKAAGVSLRTMARWMEEPAFMAALQRAQDETLGRVTQYMVKASLGAVALLGKTVQNEDAPLGLRLAAARTLLDSCLRWTELRGIEARIAALENRRDS